MGRRSTRLGSIVVVALLALPTGTEAHGVSWGVKAGIHSTSVERVSDYYDWVLNSEESNDPRLSRGDPETDLYATQILAYSAPELLRQSQFSVAVGAGWVYRRLLLEVRLTQGLQSMFKDRDGLVEGFVEVGADEATVRDLVPQFAPFLEGARGRDLAVFLGLRF